MLSEAGTVINMQLAHDGIDTRKSMLCQSIYRGNWRVVNGTPTVTNALVKAPTYDLETAPGLTRNNILMDDEYSDNGKIIQVPRISKPSKGHAGMPEIPSA